MKTTWMDLRSVILEEDATQGFAENIQGAVLVGPTSINQTVKVYVPLTQNRVNFIRMGFKYDRWPTDCRSRITEMAIHKRTGLETVSELYRETVCLNSETYNFYTFPAIQSPDPGRDPSLANLTNPCNPAIPYDNSINPDNGLPIFYSNLNGGLILEVVIEFVDFRDKFVLGPIGIEDISPTAKEVTPLEFGAVADGLADDTTALEQTIAYALAKSLPINLLNRAYAFSRTLEIEGPAGVTHRGLILCNGDLRYTATTGTAIHVGKSVGTIPTVSMDNIRVTGGGEIGLDLSRSHNSSFDKVVVSGGFDVGVRLLGSYFSNFRHCAITDNKVNVQISGYTEGTDFFRSNDNKFWNCKLLGATGEACVYIGELGSSRDLVGTNNAFYSCDFEGFDERAVIVDGGHGTSFIDCRFERPGGNANIMVHLRDHGESTRFVNCWFIMGGADNFALEVEPGHRYVRAVNTRINVPQGAGSNNVEADLTW